MTAVIVAIVSAVGGVLAGALPALLMSQRRRLLRLIEEEAKALDVVTDAHAREQLSRALRATTRQYHRFAVRDPAEKSKRRLLTWFPLVYLVVLLGSAVGLMPQSITDSARGQEIVTLVCGLLVTGAFLVLVLMVANYFYMVRERRRETRKLAAIRERNRNLQSVHDRARALVEDAFASKKVGVGATQGAAAELLNLLTSDGTKVAGGVSEPDRESADKSDAS